MVYFEKLFREQQSNTVTYNNCIYHRYFPVVVENNIKLRFKIISSNSVFGQAIVLLFPPKFNSNVFLMGKEIHIKKSSFPKLNFWTDTSPEEFEVDISNFTGEIKICNGSDPLGSKQFCKYLSEGCAMIVTQMGEHKFRFNCNDHEYDDDCNDLVFDLEVIT